MEKIKFLILLVAISVAGGVPWKSSSKAIRELEKLKVQSLMNRRTLQGQKFNYRNNYEEFIEKIAEPEISGDQFETRSIRLPNNTIPLHYDLSLRTNVHRSEFGFYGIARINVRALEQTNVITLHSRQMIIESISIINPNGTFFSNASHSVHTQFEFLDIELERELEAAQEVIVVIEYAGVLRTDLAGFHRLNYRDTNTDTVFHYATTHFQPVSARHAFPCFDEIRYRTKFNLQITHHSSYHAVSNMPIERTITDGEYVTTVFEETPSMQTYLLSFTVSNFDSISSNSTHIPIRLFARPVSIAAGEANDALRTSELMLTTMEEHFKIPYSLPKSDMIAIPVKIRDGTEYWGIISIIEFLVLDLPGVWERTTHEREMTIAHEYAHNYFGNLVSPSSWSYLWLSEGFARLYENVLNDIAFPEKDQWAEFLIVFSDFVFQFDVDGNENPLNFYAETPLQINQKFGWMTYNKGAILLRMFKDAFTEATFTKGVQYYLIDNQYQGATPTELYDALQRAYDEDFPERSLDVTTVMSPWFDLRGFPILTVSRNERGLHLRQDGFRQEHNELFPIPINYATASHPNFEDKSAEFWLTTREMDISIENSTHDDWVIFNLQDTSYFVTNYDNGLWQLIIDALMNDHEAIHFLNRGTLFADFTRFIQQNFGIDYTLFFQMIESLIFEQHPHVWRRAEQGIFLMETRLRGSTVHRQFMSFMQDIMSQVYNRIETDDQGAIFLINNWSCLSGVQECLQDSLETLIEELDSGAVATTWRGRCNGVMAANETVWMRFFNVTLAMASNARFFDLIDLICTQDRELIKHLLDATVDFTNNLSENERENILLWATWEHEVSFDAMIELIQENHEIISTRLFGISRYITSLAFGVNTECQAERVLDLIRFIRPGDRILTRQDLYSTMERNIAFKTGNVDSFRTWFDNYELRANH